MPKHLSEEQITQFDDQGFCSPIDVISENEARILADRLKEAERQYPDALAGKNRNNAHLVFSFLDEIAFHPVILDIVEDLLGENFLLWGSVMFIKEPQSAGYVSWHQDATYMGLEPHTFITPWLALSPSNRESGCMSMIPGSHKNSIQQHFDTYEDDNLLTRGQNIADVDTSQAVDLILKPGQLSVHHCRTIHGSRANTSDQRRIGVALQSYMRPDVKASAALGHTIPCRGCDPMKHHKVLTRPTGDMTTEGVNQRDEVNENWSKILYRGAEKTRDY